MSAGICPEDITLCGGTGTPGSGKPCIQCGARKGFKWFSAVHNHKPILPMESFGANLAGTSPIPACSDDCARAYFFKCFAVRRMKGEPGHGRF